MARSLFVFLAILWCGTVSAALTDGLMLYYDFEQLVGGSGVPDRSESGYDGQVRGAGTITLAGGRFGQAARFQGPDPVYVSLPTPIPHDEIPTDAITLVAWVNHDVMADNMEIFMPMSAAGDYPAKQLAHFELRSNNSARFLLRTPVDPAADLFNLNNLGSVPAEQWVHYAATYDSAAGVGTLYINGLVVGEANATRPMYNNWDEGARVGYCVDNARPFFGYMDDFAIWRRALSADEINDVMNNSVPLPPPPVEITIDGDFADWAYVPVAIQDPDDIAENNGDIREIRLHSTLDTFYAKMTVYGTAAPPPPDAQRYYYHVLLDADNNAATGFNNATYEGSPTGVVHAIGADFYAMIGRRNGADDGLEVYFCHSAEDQEVVAENFSYKASGDSIELSVPFAMFIPKDDIGEIFKPNQPFMVAAFQEGNANGWEVDWTEPAEHSIVAEVNEPPTLTVDPTAVSLELCGESVSCTITATADDPEDDTLTFQWSVSAGATIAANDPPTSATATFTAAGNYTVTCTVSDGTSTVSADAAVAVAACPGTYLFIGDANCDASVNIADAVCTLEYLFGATGAQCKTPCCLANEDANGDDSVNIADAVSILTHLFAGGTMTAPDGTLLSGAAVGCSRYLLTDVVLECATPCNP
jgi:plastocyanin